MTRPSQHVLVIGAGIVGLSTAYALLTQGMRSVTIVEQAHVDHARSTSHGFSRLLRFEYGPDELYSRMVQQSLARWRALEQASRRELYEPCGVLVLGRKGDLFTRASYEVVRGMGLPIEQLSVEDCHRHFPQFATSTFDTCTYNVEGGILHASSCLQTLRDLVRDLGGTIVEDCRIERLDCGNLHRRVNAYTSSGDMLAADRVVVAAGPWIHRLLPNHGLPVRMTRQYLLYFAELQHKSFETGVFPAFLADNLYGFPIHNNCNGWVKAASHDLGAPVSPDEITPPDQHMIARICQQLYDLLPALRSARVARVDSCIYDVSPDGDFILDRLPDDPRVIVATGLSGHGFKFGLLLGEVLSSLVRDVEPVIALQRFGLGRFTAIHPAAWTVAFCAPPPGVSC